MELVYSSGKSVTIYQRTQNKTTTRKSQYKREIFMGLWQYSVAWNMSVTRDDTCSMFYWFSGGGGCGGGGSGGCGGSGVGGGGFGCGVDGAGGGGGDGGVGDVVVVRCQVLREKLK